MVKNIKVMSEKEIIEASAEVFNSPKEYNISNTLVDAQNIGKFPRRLTGV